jgi:hypothetical protein
MPAKTAMSGYRVTDWKNISACTMLPSDWNKHSLLDFAAAAKTPDRNLDNPTESMALNPTEHFQSTTITIEYNHLCSPFSPDLKLLRRPRLPATDFRHLVIITSVLRNFPKTRRHVQELDRRYF